MSGLFTGSISMRGKQFIKGSHAFLFGILACLRATDLEIQFHLQLELRICQLLRCNYASCPIE